MTLTLSADEAKGLRHLLRRAADDVRKDAEARERAARQAAQEVIDCERLVLLATLTARTIGAVPGVPAAYLAEAAWTAFIRFESLFDPLDVRESFGTNDWAEVFQDAFTSAVAAMEQRGEARITACEAKVLARARTEPVLK